MPVGTAHITLNATLGPSQKTLASKFPEAACTQQLKESKENCTDDDQWPSWLVFSYDFLITIFQALILIPHTDSLI
jgi:hypothetical protein